MTAAETQPATEKAEGVVVDELAVTTIEERPDTQIAIFGTNDPVEIVLRTTEIANAIGTAIEKGGMTTKIQGNKYVKIEGWSLLGTMLKVFPRVIRIDSIEEDGKVIGFEAEMGLFTQDNVQVGSAVAECTKLEQRWANNEMSHIKSMAQTRATGKAFRMTFGYVMPMAGFAATPAEEMDGVPNRGASPQQPQPRPAATKPADESPKKRTTVKSLLEWAQETYEYDRKAVYGILDVTNEDGVKDIGLREAAERIRDHHDNPGDNPAGTAESEQTGHSDDQDAPPPDEADGEFRQED